MENSHTVQLILKGRPLYIQMVDIILKIMHMEKKECKMQQNNDSFKFERTKLIFVSFYFS